MAKKKTESKKNESQTKRSSGKEKSNPANESLGVHLINRQDAESHFGASEIKKDDGESGQTAAKNRPKTEIRMEIDERVWRQARVSAEKMGLELPQYVERALERFNEDDAK